MGDEGAEGLQAALKDAQVCWCGVSFDLGPFWVRVRCPLAAPHGLLKTFLTHLNGDHSQRVLVEVCRYDALWQFVDVANRTFCQLQRTVPTGEKVTNEEADELY